MAGAPGSASGARGLKWPSARVDNNGVSAPAHGGGTLPESARPAVPGERLRDGRARRAALSAASLVAAVGLLVLAAWIFDIPWLKGPLPGQVQMMANTAIGLIGLGGGLFLAVSGRSPRTRLVMSVLVGLSILIGVLTLLEYALGRSFGIDELLFRDVRPVHTVHPGRLAPQTAISFVCAGFALLLQTRGARTTRRQSGGRSA